MIWNKIKYRIWKYFHPDEYWALYYGRCLLASDDDYEINELMYRRNYARVNNPGEELQLIAKQLEAQNEHLILEESEIESKHSITEKLLSCKKEINKNWIKAFTADIEDNKLLVYFSNAHIATVSNKVEYINSQWEDLTGELNLMLKN